MEQGSQENLHSSPESTSCWEENELLDSQSKPSDPYGPHSDSVLASEAVEPGSPRTPPQQGESVYERAFGGSPLATDRPIDDSLAEIEGWKETPSSSLAETSVLCDDGKEREKQDGAEKEVEKAETEEEEKNEAEEGSGEGEEGEEFEGEENDEDEESVQSHVSVYSDDHEWEQNGFSRRRSLSQNALVEADSFPARNEPSNFESSADESRSNVKTDSAVRELQVAEAPVIDDSERFPNQGLYFIDSLSDELTNLKTCAKRALELGKRAQRFAAAEITQLRGEKLHTEAIARKYVELNHELRQQLMALRDENQRLMTEKHLEVLAMHHEKERLERERDNLEKSLQDEKKKQEKAVKENNSLLTELQEEKTRMSALQKASGVALQEKAAILEAMAIERDAAVTALHEGMQRLDEEKEEMLETMREMTSKMDSERDSKQKPTRRSSMEVFTAKPQSPGRKLSKWNSVKTSLD